MNKNLFSSAIKILLICLLLSGISRLRAQTNFSTVDRESIQMQVTNENAGSYYPKLLARFNAFDTTLSNADYRLLYYGFVFQEKYQGYNDMKEKEIREAINGEKYKKAIELCDSVLSAVPISLSSNYYRGLAMYLTDSTDMHYAAYRDRYYKLMNAIISSGDGLSCETGFKTIFVPDEYQIIYNYLEIDDLGSQSLIGHCDMFQVSKSTYFKADELYFDTSESLNALSNLFKDIPMDDTDKPSTKKHKKKKNE